MGKQFHVGDDFAGGVDMSGQATTENQHGEMIEPRRTATMNNKRLIAEIYDECRIEGFVDDASVVQKVLTKVLEKSATSETSKKLFLRSQLQSLRKELGRIAEATYLEMISKILMQTPEILDAVFQSDRSNKILETLAEKVHKQLPDDLVEAQQQAACLDAVMDSNSELGGKMSTVTQMMVEYVIEQNRMDRRPKKASRIVQDPSSDEPPPSRSHP